MTDTPAVVCPSWCTVEHKDEQYMSHSGVVAEFGPYTIMIGRIAALGRSHVHLMDSRAFTTSGEPGHVSSRESAFMEIDEAAALAEVLRRATTVAVPRDGKVATSAKPYVAALDDLRRIGEAITKGVRILDSTPA